MFPFYVNADLRDKAANWHLGSGTDLFELALTGQVYSFEHLHDCLQESFAQCCQYEEKSIEHEEVKTLHRALLDLYYRFMNRGD